MAEKTGTEDVRALAKRLQSEIEYGSRFAFQDDLHVFIRTPETRVTTNYRLNDMQIKGSFDIEHSFILWAVHTLGFATYEMVQYFLSFQKKKYPEKEIKEMKPDYLKNKLIFLAGAGLLVCYNYKVAKSGRIVKFYCCTVYGHNVFRNMLNMGYTLFDECTLFRSEMERFKRMSANSVALAFGLDEDCKDLCFNGKYGMPNFPKIRNYVYAGADFGETFYLVEPVYFRVDKRIETEEENREKVAKRLTILYDFEKKFKEEYKKKIKVVFTVEDLEGLKKLSQLLQGMTSDSGLIEGALFTCENVIYKYPGRGVSDAFLRRIADGEETRFVPARDTWKE